MKYKFNENTSRLASGRGPGLALALTVGLFGAAGACSSGEDTSTAGSTGQGGAGSTTSSVAVTSTTTGTGGAGGEASSTGGGGDAATTTTSTTGTGGAGGAGGSGGSGAQGGAGGSGGAGCVDDVALPLDAVPPTLLSQTGLYADILNDVVADYALPFDVSFALWSDASAKDRWVYIPKCAQIDTTDMDHWVFPVGTRFWKKFSVNGARIETRMIHRFGPGPSDWIYAAYEWNAQLTDATFVPNGVVNASGTTHDIPKQTQCVQCHDGLSEKVLGFGAMQLSHVGGGETIATLSDKGILTKGAPQGFLPPGDATDQAALGYLHANCGHCHFFGSVYPPVFNLRLSVDDMTPEGTAAYVTSVGVMAVGFSAPGVTHRIAAGDPAASAVSFRMASRGDLTQMPPLATEIVHPEGVAAVDVWIQGL